MRLVSGPLIHLTFFESMTINDRLRHGDYGPTIFIGRVRYCDLAAVEAFHGLKFTESQIAIAAAGRSDRCIILEETTEVA
jgi:hypothetical protein